MAVTNSSGTLTSQQRYLPFGEARTVPDSPITVTDFGFTGQRDLDGTGLMDYRARFYSQSLGRFLQPDTIIPNLSSPQSWNRFSYVNNSPVNYNDPTGHRCYDPNDPESDPLDCQKTRSTYKTRNQQLRDKIFKLAPNITISNLSAWTPAQLDMIYLALLKTIKAFNHDFGAFYAAFGIVNFIPAPLGGLGYDNNGNPYPGRGWDGVIRLAPNASQRTVIHELGHIFDDHDHTERPYGYLKSQLFVSLFNDGTCELSSCSGEGWMPTGRPTAYGMTSSLEDFADSFLALVYYGPQTYRVGKERLDAVQMWIDLYAGLDYPR